MNDITFLCVAKCKRHGVGFFPTEDAGKPLQQIGRQFGKLILPASRS
jgi:hypothetical protein